MRKVFAVLLISLLVLILGVYGCIRVANPNAGYDNIRISKETTYIIEPLDETGMVDFVEAINKQMSEGVTPENNAAVLLWQAAGPAEILSDVRGEFFKRLGIEPLPDQGDYFVDFDDFVQAHPELLPQVEDTDDTTGESTPEMLAEEQFDQAMRRPWSAEEFPIVAAWLEANQGPLKLIAAAADRTHYYSPHIGWSVVAAMLPDIQFARENARVLNTRAMLRLHQGNVEAAWQDLHRCHRLAGHFARVPNLVSYLVAIAIDGMAFDGDLAIAQDQSLSPDQRQQLWQAFRELPSLPSPVHCFDVGERLAFIDAVVYMAQDIAAPDLGIEAGPLSRIRSNYLVDWNKVLVSGNQWYDRIVKAFERDTYKDRAAALKTIQEELDAHLEELERPWYLFKSLVQGSALTDTFGGTMIDLFLPASDVFLQATMRHESHRQLVDIAFALQQYQAEHESYPETLGDLVPKYLAELPRDLFTEEDLTYRRQDGGYLLYSVGANQQDDEGFSTWKDEDTDGDDIAVRVPRAEPAVP